MDSAGKKDQIDRARQRMLRQDLGARGIKHPGVVAAMGQIRREEFVPENYASQAYSDGPLPIGCGQTISQPYIVALMTQELRVTNFCEVLEIGTGCGYQTAILARVAKWVYTIERYPELSERAQAVLGRLGITNVTFAVGDGSYGWSEDRTFERIMVTAAVPSIPKPLVEQLKDGGMIVAPVGSGGVQELIVGSKRGKRLAETAVCDVRFVKLIGEYGFKG